MEILGVKNSNSEFLICPCSLDVYNESNKGRTKLRWNRPKTAKNSKKTP